MAVSSRLGVHTYVYNHICVYYYITYIEHMHGYLTGMYVIHTVHIKCLILVTAYLDT